MSKMGKIVIAAVAVVVVLGVGLWYVVLRDTSEPTASLDSIDVPTTTASPTGTGGSTGTAAAATSADGTWAVVAGEDVFVGYRVEELFGGQTIKKTATGRTPAVTGTVEIQGATIPAATFTADVTQLKSDDARRDGALGTRGLQTETFPEATFTLTEPITLPSEPAVGEEITVSATGDLTLHGVTAPVTLELEAKWTGTAVTVAGSAPIVFADFGMEAIDIANVVTTDDHGVLELQLVLEPA